MFDDLRSQREEAEKRKREFKNRTNMLAAELDPMVRNILEELKNALELSPAAFISNYPEDEWRLHESGHYRTDQYGFSHEVDQQYAKVNLRYDHASDRFYFSINNHINCGLTESELIEALKEVLAPKR